MVEVTIFKGYSPKGEVWAIGKTYGSGDTKTRFIAEVEPNQAIIDEYERQKNVFNNTGKKKWLCRWKIIPSWKGSSNI